MSATPSKLDAIQRSAARRIGVSLEEYVERRTGGEAWCGECRRWLPMSAFVRNRASPTGRTALCREHHNAAKREDYAQALARRLLADALPSDVRRHSPVERVRLILEISRARGETFDVAWPVALNVLPADDRAAIADTIDGWKRAYRGEPATAAEIAVVALAEALQTFDDCERMGRPAPYVSHEVSAQTRAA